MGAEQSRERDLLCVSHTPTQAMPPAWARVVDEADWRTWSLHQQMDEQLFSMLQLSPPNFFYLRLSDSLPGSVTLVYGGGNKATFVVKGKKIVVVGGDFQQSVSKLLSLDTAVETYLSSRNVTGPFYQVKLAVC